MRTNATAYVWDEPTASGHVTLTVEQWSDHVMFGIETSYDGKTTRRTVMLPNLVAMQVADSINAIVSLAALEPTQANEEGAV